MNTEIKVENVLSKGIQITDWSQGDLIFPVLFNLALEKILQEDLIGQFGAKLNNTTVEMLVYTVGVMYLAESEDDITSN